MKPNRAGLPRRKEATTAPPTTTKPARLTSLEARTEAPAAAQDLLPDVLQRARLRNAPVSSAEVGALHAILGNQAIGRIARASSTGAREEPSAQKAPVHIQRMLIQRTWASDRVDWVNEAIKQNNWAGADPQGAFYILNGLSTPDMTNILRMLGGAARATLQQHLETDGKAFGRWRIHMCLGKALWPENSPYQDMIDKVHTAMFSGNYANDDWSAYAILERSGAFWRQQLIYGLHPDLRNELQSHETEGSKLKNKERGTTFPGFTTSLLHYETGRLMPGDVAFYQGRQFVIYADVVREIGSGTVAWVTNNPGAMRDGEWAGAFPGKFYTTEGAGRFAIFPSYKTGWDAVLLNLQGLSKGKTILETMEHYAPRTDPINKPEVYAKTVADALGVKPDTPTAGLSLEQFKTWRDAIYKTEESKVGLEYAHADTRVPQEIRDRLNPPKDGATPDGGAPKSDAGAP